MEVIMTNGWNLLEIEVIGESWCLWRGIYKPTIQLTTVLSWWWWGTTQQWRELRADYLWRDLVWWQKVPNEPSTLYEYIVKGSYVSGAARMSLTFKVTVGGSSDVVGWYFVETAVMPHAVKLPLSCNNQSSGMETMKAGVGGWRDLQDTSQSEMIVILDLGGSYMPVTLVSPKWHGAGKGGRKKG